MNFIKNEIFRIIKFLENYKEQLFLIIIFIISFIIRRIGLQYGFPLMTHPDEAFSLDPVYNMTINKSLNSNTFNRPDQILLTFNFVYLNIISYFHFGKSMAHTYWENQLTFYYYGRMLICIMGSLIPLVAYKIGKEFKINFSIPAAIVFAFFPSYVIHSHYITPDIPITLITLLVILFAIKYLNEEKSIYLYVATIFSAINTAEKYPGLLSIAIILVTISIQIFRKNELSIREKIFILLKYGLRILGVFFLAFYIVAPNVFIEFGKVIQTIQYEARSTHLGADNLGWFGNMFFYFESFSSFSNLFGIILILIGFFYIIKTKNFNFIPLFYGAFYWVSLSFLSLHWERWALPMYITLLFLISIGIKFLIDKTREQNYLKFLSFLFFSVFIISQFISSLSKSIQFTFQDTRYAALEYCIENGITPEITIFEGYTPYNPRSPGNIFEHDFNGSDYKFAILSSQMFARYYNEPSRYSNEIVIYEEINNNYPLIKEFTPTKNDLPELIEDLDNIVYYAKLRLNLTSPTRFSGPIIKIFSINK